MISCEKKFQQFLWRYWIEKKLLELFAIVPKNKSFSKSYHSNIIMKVVLKIFARNWEML